MGKSLGIYVHIPFCIQKCGYCDFCSFPSMSEGIKERYTDELCRRISGYASAASAFEADTVYFGGGTPSTLSVSCVERILNAIKKTFKVSDRAEITFECNPGTVDGKYFSAIRSAGVNRISMGLQSALDSELSLLGRIHSRGDFEKCFWAARDAGFDNISADVMYGIPDQTMESFEETLRFLTALEPEHISAYGLMIEEGTSFEKRVSELRLADDDGQYDMYMLCGEYLAARGYEKYEISNFARRGKRSRHNTRYWLGEEYLGFGVAAHSYLDGRRLGNSRDIDAFLRGEDVTEEEYELSDRDKREEYVMLRLRLAEGISLDEYRNAFGLELLDGRVEKWIRDGFMRLEDGRLSFTDKGFFVSNSILSELLDAEA